MCAVQDYTGSAPCIECLRYFKKRSKIGLADNIDSYIIDSLIKRHGGKLHSGGKISRVRFSLFSNKNIKYEKREGIENCITRIENMNTLNVIYYVNLCVNRYNHYKSCGSLKEARAYRDSIRKQYDTVTTI